MEDAASLEPAELTSVYQVLGHTRTVAVHCLAGRLASADAPQAEPVKSVATG
jgi:hypothetical protein